MNEYKDGPLDLVAIAREHLGQIHRNFSTSRLYEEIIRGREGHIAHLGPVVVATGRHTGLSDAEKIVVQSAGEGHDLWRGGGQHVMNDEQFRRLFERMLAYMRARDLHVQDCYAGREHGQRLCLRVATQTAWHALFARNMFRQITDPGELASFKPDFTIVHIPGFHADPRQDGVQTSAFVVVHPGERIMLIGGTDFAGELKQAAFTIGNFVLSSDSVLTVRCAVNQGQGNDVAMFMGRSGTGKTALSADPEYSLVGDHAHGWNDTGVFSLEWGGYARVAGLDPQKQPLLYENTRKFGTILENVTLRADRRFDFDDLSLTDNTRAAYPITHFPKVVRSGQAGHPRHLFLLTCDAFGVLPPIARLTADQAVYALLTSYSSEFSDGAGAHDPGKYQAGFGAFSLMLEPHKYARAFLGKLKQHDVRCWFINTGWTGEPAGGIERNSIDLCRRLIRAARSGELDRVAYEVDPVFEFEVPRSCPGLEPERLDPRARAEDEGEYELRANQLALQFVQHFEQFRTEMPEDIRGLFSNVVLLDESLDIMERFRISI